MFRVDGINTSENNIKSMLFFGIRHGECDRDPVTQKYKDDSVCLNTEGIHQIHLCSTYLHQFVFHSFSEFRIYCSPIHRVLESAQLLKEGLEHVGGSWQHGSIHIDGRLSNKQSSECAFEEALSSFLFDLQQEAFSSQTLLLVVTHGRILKMLNSFCRFGCLDTSYTHQLPDFHPPNVYTFYFPFLADHHGITF